MRGQQNIKKCNIPLSVSHLVLNCKLAIVFVHVCIYINSTGQVLREDVDCDYEGVQPKQCECQ